MLWMLASPSDAAGAVDGEVSITIRKHLARSHPPPCPALNAPITRSGDPSRRELPQPTPPRNRSAIVTDDRAFTGDEGACAAAIAPALCASLRPAARRQ